MLVVFPYIGSENIGISYLSGMLKAHGIETRLAFEPSLFDDTKFLHIPAIPKLFHYNERFATHIAQMRPDVLAFSVFTMNYLWALDIAQRVRSKIDVVTVFGGKHVQALPHQVLANTQVDYIVRGEGEYPLLELTQSLGNGQVDLSIPNLGYKRGEELVLNPVRPLIENLDELPPPDRDLFAKVEDFGASLLYLCGRGCAYRCSFCSNDLIRKQYPNPQKYVRFQSVDRCIEELKQLKSKYHPRSFLFQDDVFIINKPWMNEFCHRYKDEIGLPFQTTGYPGVVTEEDIRILKDAGCDSIEIGVQSFNPANRKNILYRNESNEDVANCVEWCHKYNMAISLDYIFFPWEANETDQLNAAQFFYDHPPDRIANFYLSYLPSTEVVSYAIKEGYLSESDLAGVETGVNAYYHAGGEFLANKAQLRFFNRFYNFFILLTMLPRFWGGLLFKIRAYRYADVIPRTVLIVMKELILSRISKKYKENPFFTKYILYYVKNIKVTLLGKYA